MGHAIERDISARDEDAVSGNRGRGHAGRRRFSEPDDRRDPQKSYPGHARKIMNAIWSLGQAMFTKVSWSWITT